MVLPSWSAAPGRGRAGRKGKRWRHSSRLCQLPGVREGKEGRERERARGEGGVQVAGNKYLHVFRPNYPGFREDQEREGRGRGRRESEGRKWASEERMEGKESRYLWKERTVGKKRRKDYKGKEEVERGGTVEERVWKWREGEMEGRERGTLGVRVMD